MVIRRTGFCYKFIYKKNIKTIIFSEFPVDKKIGWCYLKYMDVSTPHQRVLIKQKEAVYTLYMGVKEWTNSN